MKWRSSLFMAVVIGLEVAKFHGSAWTWWAAEIALFVLALFGAVLVAIAFDDLTPEDVAALSDGDSSKRLDLEGRPREERVREEIGVQVARAIVVNAKPEGVGQS